MEASAARIDPPRSAKSASDLYFIGPHPDPTHSRPPSLGLCKQEVTGSISVGCIEKALHKWHFGISAEALGSRHPRNSDLWKRYRSLLWMTAKRKNPVDVNATRRFRVRARSEICGEPIWHVNGGHSPKLRPDYDDGASDKPTTDGGDVAWPLVPVPARSGMSWTECPFACPSVGSRSSTSLASAR